MTDAVFPKLEIKDVLLDEARTLIAARDRSANIHRTKDIGAAGDEVEIAVRKFLRNKLPGEYNVTHGHVIDARLNTSSQFDVIVTDSNATPTIFRTHNETEYVPFESVYAIGEVKSTYYSSQKPIHAFVDRLDELRANLVRERVPPEYVARGLILGKQFAIGGDFPYRNPLYSVMLFVNGGDFEMQQVASLYRSRALGDLPNLVCLLDRGVLINTQASLGADGKWQMGAININPGFTPRESIEGCRWSLIEFGAPAVRPASSLAFLYMALMHHVNRCLLKPPVLLDYLRSLFEVHGGTVVEPLGPPAT